MPELKHGFEKARMNKDLDERLVPSGEYRDANNIQVSTSEGSNAGVVQNIAGNKLHATIDHTSTAYYGVPTTSTCVASIEAPDKDKVYYFVSSSDLNSTAGRPAICKDYILEYDTITEKHKYVFVDIWRVKTKAFGATSDVLSFKINDDISSTGDDSDTINKTGVRVGMRVTGGSNNYQPSDAIVVTDVSIDSGEWKITTNLPTSFSDNNNIVFEHDRVLHFSKDVIVTGINVLDNFIYWTDNVSEPKKINIERSIAGTGGVEYLVGGGIAGFSNANVGYTDTIFKGDTDYFHTRLVKSNPDGSDVIKVVTNEAGNKAVWANESHVTVIRPAPTQPLELEMYRVTPDKVNLSGVAVATACQLNDFNFFKATNADSPFVSGEIELHEVGDSVFIPQLEETGDASQGIPNIPAGMTNGGDNGDVPSFSGAPNGVCFEEGDTLVFTRSENTIDDPGNFQDYDIRARVVVSPSNGPDNPSNGGYPVANAYKLEILSIASSSVIHSTDVNWFVRIETTDALFEHKFPRFSYRYKYTDGEYSPFAPFSEIAFLPDKYSYEPKDGYNFGMVNQLRSLALKYYHYDEDCIPQDLAEIDILYKETNNPAVFVVKTLKRSDASPVWPDLGNTGDPFLRGKFTVTTDMIHAAVPTNQLLRPWDNVPRMALAQEISANRLIYGNYLQNYTVDRDPTIELSLGSDDSNSDYAMPSVKTLRTYQVGVVYSDRYGRETPILTGLDSTGKPNSMTVNKPASPTRNRLKVRLSDQSFVPGWAEYMTYFVKETSTEYYTLASDRWYDAEDGNVWLSFPSSERNKLVEQNFIELKKTHGSSKAVIEPARFKILAIENEAPNYIKTVLKSLGTLIDNDNIGNNSGFGYPVLGLNFMTILTTHFEGTFGDIGSVSGNTSLVLSSNENRSKIYRVESITDTGNGYTKILLDESFGQDINFTVDLEGLFVQLFEHKVENKPEFDGRFFAKIARNHVLETYILNAMANDEAELFLWGSFNLGYLNPDIYWNNLSTSSLDSCAQESILPYVSPTDDTSVGFQSNAHPTEYTGNWDGVSGEAQYFWSGAPDEDNPLGYGVDLQENGPTKALAFSGSSFWSTRQSDDHGNGNPSFFIDASPAWSWTSSGIVNSGLFGGPNVGDRPGCQYHDDWWWVLDEEGVFFNTLWGDAVGQEVGHWSGDEAGNMKINKGQPSRGIWNGGVCMDISWTGMGDGYTGNGGGSFADDAPYPHELSEWDQGYSDMNDAHEQGWYFIQKLTTPGTKWRFKRDPRDVVDSLYTSTTFYDVQAVNYGVSSIWENGTTDERGAWGIRNYATTGGGADERQYLGRNLRQRWTITVGDPIGGDTEYGYSPIKGTDPDITSPGASNPDFRRAIHHDYSGWNTDLGYDAIEIYEKIQLYSEDRSHFSKNPAVWETIPEESVELDIYYQASGLIPLTLKDRTNEEYIPIGSTIVSPDSDSYTVKSWTGHNKIQLTTNLTAIIYAGTTVRILKRNNYECTAVVSNTATAGQPYISIHGDSNTPDPTYKIHTQQQTLDWSNCWSFGNGVESDRIRDDFNAAQVDNGVKASSGIGRQVREERRKHGIIWSGIYNSTSGVNDTNQFIMAESITKDLNPVHGSLQALLNRDTRLIMFCEDKVLRAVTNKDALYNADGNPQLIASNSVIGDVQPYQGEFGIAMNPESVAENPYAVYFTDAMRGKVLRLTTEGVVAISDIGMKDHFADLMKDNVWRCLGTFDERKNEYNLTVSKKYTKTQQVAHEATTVTYSDYAKGWTSFKSFAPQSGCTINNNYYTFWDGQLYKHHDETSITHYGSIGGTTSQLYMSTTAGLEAGMLVTGVGIPDGVYITSITDNAVNISMGTTSLFIPQDITFSTPRNTFYGAAKWSDVTLVFNDVKDAVKSFQTIQYNGSKAAIEEWDAVSAGLFTNNYSDGAYGLTSANISDGEYYNLDAKDGWYVGSILTDLQESNKERSASYFKNKEGKYFAYITGDTTNIGNLDEKEFSVQGLGNATMQHDTDGYGGEVTIRVTANTSSTYQGTDADGDASTSGVWDNSATVVSEAAKWVCGVGSRTAVGGTDIGDSDSVAFTLSPIINGVYSGTPVAAENLEWSGASGSGNVWTHQAGAKGDPIDNDNILKVSFANTGVAGDPSNEVTVTVQFNTADTWPTADALWYIDIDETAVHEDGTDTEMRDVAFEVHWPYYATSALNAVTPDNISTPDITETQLVSGVVGGAYTQWKFIGNDIIDSGDTTLVYSDVFTAAADHHFQSVPTYNTTGMGPYESQYQVQILPSYSEGLVVAFSIKVYYTASINPSMFPDPPNNTLYNLGHKIILSYSIKQTHSGIIDTITDVLVPRSLPLNGGSVPIKVYGTSGSTYRLSIERKLSVTSPVTDATGYYNHSSGDFESNIDTSEFTVPSSGVKVHYVSISRISPTEKEVDVRFSVTAQASGTTSLASGVPISADDAVITQYGWRSISLYPMSFNSSNYATFPANEVRYLPVINASGNEKTPDDSVLTTLGGNGGVSKTLITLTGPSKRIKVGMRVVAEVPDIVGADTSTPIITHGTTVSKVDGRDIYLSVSHAVADGTEIRFINNNRSLIPFSFQIEAAGGRGISLTNGVDLTKMIGWSNRTSVLTSSAVNGKVVALDDINGIKVGDRVNSKSISSAQASVVVSLDSATQVTLDHGITVPDNTKLYFSNNHQVNLINASKVVIGGDVFIRGHLSVTNITESVAIPIFLDNIITNTGS